MTSKAQLQEQVNNLRWDLSSVRDGMARRDYRQRRTDSWLSAAPTRGSTGSPRVSPTPSASSSTTSCRSGGRAPACSATTSPAHRRRRDPPDDLPGHPARDGAQPVHRARRRPGLLRSGDLAEIEEWFRWASTGEKFDPAAAAEALNAL